MSDLDGVASVDRDRLARHLTETGSAFTVGDVVDQYREHVKAWGFDPGFSAWLDASGWIDE